MDLILCDVNDAVVAAWRTYFDKIPNVTVTHGSVFEVRCDALVSPANSFGFMDGGIDMAISQYFGWEVQEQLQKLIRRKYHGELLVGQAEIVPTYHVRIPYVIAAPTMRVPTILGHDTVNIYLATRAVLLLVQNGVLVDETPVREVVTRVAIPGMGTGVGKVPPDVCARQMKQAVDEFLNGSCTFPTSWYDAERRHQLLYRPSSQDFLP